MLLSRSRTGLFFIYLFRYELGGLTVIAVPFEIVDRTSWLCSRGFGGFFPFRLLDLWLIELARLEGLFSFFREEFALLRSFLDFDSTFLEFDFFEPEFSFLLPSPPFFSLSHRGFPGGDLLSINSDEQPRDSLPLLKLRSSSSTL